MNGWPLRARFVALLALLLLPIVVLAGWRALDQQRDLRRMRAALVSNAVDNAVAPYREAVQGADRVLAALREDQDIHRWIGEALAPDELARCQDSLRRLLRQVGERYSILVLVDAKAARRCATSPDGDTRFGESLLGTVRERGAVVIAQQAARTGDQLVLPAVAPVMRAGQFLGMVGIGIAWSAPGNSGSARSPLPVLLTLVDAKGQAIGGAGIIPAPERIAQATAARRTALRGEARDGQPYEYRLLSFGPDAPLMIAAVPAGAADSGLQAPWVDFALVALAAVMGLAALWFGADRWCLQPLRPIRTFAAAMARGEDAAQPVASGPPEMRSLAGDIAVMAGAIRAREQDLRASLEQRDHMLREIHHRVKNNLQMISSLLNLQADRIRSPRVRRHFSDAQNRVLALSVLHRHLYERSSWALVDFQQFISDLVRQLSMNRTNPVPSNIRTDIRAPVMAVEPDTAIPVGLIVTEAVSNAFRHAFAGIDQPAISIQATESGGMVEFTIEDNGVGIDEKIVIGGDRGSLGVTLIRGLAAQLGGEAEIIRRPGGGTRVAVRFPLPT